MAVTWLLCLWMLLILAGLLPTARRTGHIHRHGRAAGTVVVNGGPGMLRIFASRVVAHGPDAESAIARRGRRRSFVSRVKIVAIGWTHLLRRRRSRRYFSSRRLGVGWHECDVIFYPPLAYLLRHKLCFFQDSPKEQRQKICHCASIIAHSQSPSGNRCSRNTMVDENLLRFLCGTFGSWMAAPRVKE